MSAPFFIALKLEAFHGRGEGDYRASRDVEDVLAVIDGRAELVDEMERAPEALRAWLAEQHWTAPRRS